MIASPDTANSQDGLRTVLRAVGISKSYGPTRALDDVGLTLNRGEIHALLGGNGSGKSTLIKILSGIEKADSGEISFADSQEMSHADSHLPAAKMTPAKAREVGLHVVHQRSTVFPNMSVAENLALGRGYPTYASSINWKELRQHTKRVLERFEIAATPNTRLDALSPAVQTTVAVARALQDSDEASDGILILDEPTAALPTHEVQVLLSALRRYAQAGQGIILVTHRIDEILSIADRITVIRDGRLVGTVENDGLTQHELIEMMLGKSTAEVFHSDEETAVGHPMLEVENLSVGPLHGIEISLREGEIVGLAGLLGSGRTELLQGLFGARAVQGEIRLGGKKLKLRSAQDAMKSGIAYVPEDRAAAAAFLDQSVGVNVTIASLDRYWRNLRLQRGLERREVQAAIRDAGVSAPGPDARLSVLSGGNQQKVILARWLRRRPRVLLLDEPTQGVDVAARSEIHAQVRAAVREGASALLVSSDFEELADACDRVLVLAAGRVVAEVSGARLTSQELTQLVHHIA